MWLQDPNESTRSKMVAARDNPTMTPDLITCSTGVDVFGLWERVSDLITKQEKNSSLSYFS